MPNMKTFASPRQWFVHLATLVLSTLMATTAHAEGGWLPCGSEGQTCVVSSPSTVRFGADGRYAYRNVNGPVYCHDSVFGDPAYGERKQCAYRFGHNQSPDDRHPGEWSGGGWSGGNAHNESGWNFCAREKGYCDFRGTREVRFGANGRFAVRTVSGGTDCSVQVFGDPNPGVKKTCETHERSNWGGGYNRPSTPTDRGDWQVCAEEDGYCRVPRGATVRFGSDGRYAYMNRVQGEISCTVNVFGDPNRGSRKRCEFSTNSNGNLGGGWQSGGGWGNNRPNGSGGNWSFCAAENGRCVVPYPTRVRFGIDGRYNYLQVSGSVSCTPAAFGDPAEGQRKRCEYAR